MSQQEVKQFDCTLPESSIVMVRQFDHPPQSAIGPATCVRVKQFVFPLFKVLAIEYNWLSEYTLNT